MFSLEDRDECRKVTPFCLCQIKNKTLDPTIQQAQQGKCYKAGMAGYIKTEKKKIMFHIFKINEL